MSAPIGVDMRTGLVVTRENYDPNSWLMVSGFASLPTADGAEPGRMFPSRCIRESTGSVRVDPLAFRKHVAWFNVCESRRVGRRPLP